MESIKSHSPGLYSPYKKPPLISATSDAGWQHGR